MLEMQSIPLGLLGLSVVASVVALTGGIVFLYIQPLSRWIERFGVPFAAGTMIVTALMGLLPEAEHLLGTTSYAVFALSFFAALLVEQLFIQVHHHSHHHSHGKRSTVASAVPIVLIGDTIHNFIDGLAIGVAYTINPGLALLTTISTFLHEVPHEIADFSILLKAGWKRKQVVVVNVVSALLTVVGAILITQLTVSEEIIGYLMAITAGAFFYLGAIDFLPHAFEHNHKQQKRSAVMLNIVYVLLGAVVIAGIFQLVPHSHEQEHSDEDHASEEQHVEDEFHLDEDDH